MKADQTKPSRCVGIFMALALVLPAAAMAADERPAASDQPAGQGNRIVVTGNTASNVEVRCGPDGTRPSVNVNSVNVDGAAMRGKTVIVTGRNTRDVRVQDCPSDPPGQPTGSVNVNSVTIR